MSSANESESAVKFGATRGLSASKNSPFIDASSLIDVCRPCESTNRRVEPEHVDSDQARDKLWLSEGGAVSFFSLSLRNPRGWRRGEPFTSE